MKPNCSFTNIVELEERQNVGEGYDIFTIGIFAIDFFAPAFLLQTFSSYN